MTDVEIESELENLKAQLAALKEEHAKTRFGWLWWMRNTGFLLLVLGIIFLCGVLQSHTKIESTPIGQMFLMLGVLMTLFGGWLASLSLKPLAERIMETAPRW